MKAGINTKIKQSMQAQFSSIKRPLLKKNGYDRICTKSIEQLPVYIKRMQNGQEEQLFENSSTKIAKLRLQMNNNAIDKELDQILAMIRKEKIKIQANTEGLKQKIQHYETLMSTKQVKSVDQYCNTNIILQLQSFSESQTQTDKIQQKETKEIYTQTQKEIIKQYTSKEMQTQYLQTKQIKSSQLGQKSNGQNIKISNEVKKQNGELQIYKKLAAMLLQMKVNPFDILPNGMIEYKGDKKEFKQLGQSQIIKIQKFLIAKLVSRVNK